jgi:hypothetical protein
VNSDGSVNVATADTSKKTNNTGSISVETLVTYSAGSTQKSVAGLSSGLQATGSGLARKRLDAIVGDSLSESAVLKKLGVAEPDGGAGSAAHDASAGVAVDAQISADVSVSLTYAVTAVNGANHVTIDRRTESYAEFGVRPGATLAASGSVTATDVNFDALVSNGAGGYDRAQFALDQTTSQAALEADVAGRASARTSEQAGDIGVSLELTPVVG